MLTVQDIIADRLKKSQGALPYDRLSKAITDDLKEAGYLILSAKDLARKVSDSMPYA